MEYKSDTPEPPPKSARYAPKAPPLNTVNLPTYTEKYVYAGSLPNTNDGMDAPQVMTEKDWAEMEMARREKGQVQGQSYSHTYIESPGGYSASEPMAVEDQIPRAVEHPRILGLRRPYFFLLLIAAPLIIITGSVAGTFARINAQAVATSKTGFAVAGQFVKNTTQFNMHLFYQDPSTFAIYRRISTDVLSYQTQQSIVLQHIPTGPVPIAATALANKAGTGFLNLFYIMDSAIAFANLTCTATDYGNCTTLSNTIISNNLLYPVAPDSAIAAVFIGLGATEGWRVFYHNADHMVTVLSFTKGAWDAGTVIGGKAVPGSGIAATVYSLANNVNVVYIDAAQKTPYTITFFGTWTPPAILTSKPIPNFTPQTQLGLAYAFTFDSLYTYYTGSDRKVYAFTARNASNSDFVGAVSSSVTGISAPGWANTPEHEKAWMDSLTPGAGITVVGIADQVRMYQMVNNGFVQTKGQMGTASYVLQKI